MNLHTESSYASTLDANQREVLLLAMEALLENPRRKTFPHGAHSSIDGTDPVDDPELLRWIDANADIVRRFLESEYGRIENKIDSGRKLERLPLGALTEASKP